MGKRLTEAQQDSVMNEKLGKATARWNTGRNAPKPIAGTGVVKKVANVAGNALGVPEKTPAWRERQARIQSQRAKVKSKRGG